MSSRASNPSRRSPAPHAAAMVVSAAALLASCSGTATTATPSGAPASTGSSAASGSPGSSVAPVAPGSVPEGGPCAWATRADKATLNIAYPDTAATYWGLSYRLAEGETLELSGRFPRARYASFITYGPQGGALDTVSDRDLVPDDGSANPFVAPAASRVAGGSLDPVTQRFTLVVDGAPADGDTPGAIHAGLSATPTTAATTATTATTATPGSTATTAPIPEVANVLGTGGADGVRGTLLYRVYVAAESGDPAGAAGLPDVTLISGGRRQALPTCPSPGANPAATAIVNANGPATDRPAPAQPIFIRPGAGQANLYPNPDNVYVATIVQHTPGRVVVVRGKGPTFPDPAGGRAIGDGEQVRYWSFCTNEYRKPYPVSFCATDAETALDDDGWFTYVVSTPEDRPANADAEHDVTWLDWGSTEVNGLLLFRHMLADPEFAESAIHLAPGTLATASMGDYAPKGAYCTTAQFEADDPTCTPA